MKAYKYNGPARIYEIAPGDDRRRLRPTGSIVLLDDETLARYEANGTGVHFEELPECGCECGEAPVDASGPLAAEPTPEPEPAEAEETDGEDADDDADPWSGVSRAEAWAIVKAHGLDGDVNYRASSRDDLVDLLIDLGVEPE